MSYLDEQLIADLNASNIDFDIVSAVENTSIIKKINENVPFSGNKVDWRSLESSIDFGLASSALAASRLANEIRNIADEDLVFVGDSACDDSYAISLKHINKALSIFSELPQHTYIVPTSLAWIACISFEGDLNFAKLL